MKNETKKEVTIDDLALMVAQGFSTMDEKIDSGFRDVNGRLSAIETDVAVLKTDVAVLKTDVTVLKTDVTVLKTDVAELKDDVKEIKANLNKKVDKIDHNTLTYQVEKLEKKFA